MKYPPIEKALKRRNGHPVKRAAPTLRATLKLLDESPMPWTLQMLASWFGVGKATFTHFAVAQRIWRIERGLYTSNKHYVPPQAQRATYGPRVILSDDMLARWANL